MTEITPELDAALNAWLDAGGSRYPDEAFRAGYSAARASRPLDAGEEVVAIYHGNGLLDCGDSGHHNIELLKLIPAGTRLYASPSSDTVKAVKPEDEAEHFIQQTIDRAPEPLRRLGEYLADVLPEDQFATAERMLLGACEASVKAMATEELEEAVRLAEIGEYLYMECAYHYGNGYDEPREFGIDWQWQQSKPNEYGQGMLLAAATKWHADQAEDGIVTEAAKLRSALSAAPQPQPVAEGECQTCGGSGKEGRHSICRDCDETQADTSPQSDWSYHSLLGEIRHKWMDLETDTEFEDWLFSPELGALFAALSPPSTAMQEMVDGIFEAMAEALRPFATTDWADENGWTDIACQKDRIVDWFGPSEFLAASTSYLAYCNISSARRAALEAAKGDRNA